MTVRINRKQIIAASLDGFDQALERHKPAQGLRPSYISLAECVYWLATVDELLRPEAWYETERSRHSDGGLLPGLRYARNFATHQAVALAQAGPSYLTFPLYESGSLYRTFTEWVAFEDLPEPTKTTKYTPDQQASYREHLGGELTVRTLERAQEWLRAVRAIALV
ncbi:hypothetical protein GXB85_04090 [Cellulomonas sp. APG4]|uniref:hypothetical protein n=1 Tax=Cellulomonas sp. APG4 TaxID=1538656 RepID=UPI001379B98C|nr:hypothetical protein [Cellulomonas sp. APG4]NCT90135.1 hypothetical protein [Cellulomonas sp. APG4]